MSKTKTRDQLIGEFRAAGTGPMPGSEVGELADALGPYIVRQVFIFLSGSAPDHLDVAIREMGGIEDDDAAKDVRPPSAAELTQSSAAVKAAGK